MGTTLRDDIDRAKSLRSKYWSLIETIEGQELLHLLNDPLIAAARMQIKIAEAAIENRVGFLDENV